MNKKFFAGLVSMMILSVIGITLVQITWIRNAVGMANENFNTMVFRSLNSAVQEIKSKSRMNFFNDFIMNPASTDSVTGVTQYFSFGGVMSQDGSEVKIDITDNKARVRTYTDGPDGSKIIVRDDSAQLSDQTVPTIGNRQGRGNGSRQNPGVRRPGEPGENMLGRSDYIDWLRRRSGEFQNMSDQIISEMFEWEKNIKTDRNEINATLAKYLPFFGIQTPYEFALMRGDKIESAVPGKAKEDDFRKSIYKIRLFPDNMFNNDMVLSVVFPQRANFVFGSMAWILGGSMLFSLFIFSTFAFSLWFILRQKKVSEMKSDFLNNMTHEFKTPIATISLAADTILNPKVLADEGRIRHFVGMIKKENGRMNKKVETILQIATLDKKEMDFKFVETSFHQLIEKAIDTIEIQVNQRLGTISTNLAASDDTMLGDPEHLTSLIHNLLDNALKYSPERPVISVSTANRDDGIVLSVEDKGIGMSKSTQSKIFERFYRQTSGNIHDVKGFGLGLNYVKAIVDAHKGSISVTSEPGKGSRFDIFLPLNCDN
ncbi:MAG: HAMP domain-containing sensor histidine kinase [Bacteroidales bacterium]